MFVVSLIHDNFKSRARLIIYASVLPTLCFSNKRARCRRTIAMTIEGKSNRHRLKTNSESKCDMQYYKGLPLMDFYPSGCKLCYLFENISHCSTPSGADCKSGAAAPRPPWKYVLEIQKICAEHVSRFYCTRLLLHASFFGSSIKRRRVFICC